MAILTAPAPGPSEETLSALLSSLSLVRPILPFTFLAAHAHTLPCYKLNKAHPHPPLRPFIPPCPTPSCKDPHCSKLHFQPDLTTSTVPALGDCSYLNACHRKGQGCKYLHWKIEKPRVISAEEPEAWEELVKKEEVKPVKGWAEPDSDEEEQPEENKVVEVKEAQWMNIDVRYFPLDLLGQFDVIVADPPWAIHQELPYGTLTDAEMLSLPLSSLQAPGGLLFLWVTGRAMETGRQCLRHWGYERIDEIVWVKINQLGGLVRTGRTGHWLNHSKEHCLVAVRTGSSSSSPAQVNPAFAKGLDTQVLLSPVRETSRKPDELYSLIERLCSNLPGGGRKVEIFGRRHNTRKGWWTLGNQLGEEDRVLEQEVRNRVGREFPERKLGRLGTEGQLAPEHGQV